MAGIVRIDFMSNQAAGTYPSSGSKPFKGGKLAVAVAGTLGGGSIQVNMLFGGSWVPAGSAINAVGVTVLELPPCELQVVATGVGIANAYVSGVEVPTNVRH